MKIRAMIVALLAIGWYVAARADGFTLTSAQITNGAPIAKAQEYNGFGCTGSNISPELKWSGAPAGTKSFAVTVYDPDAPTGSGWWHWVIFNIPANVHELVRGAGDLSKDLAPKGAVQSRTDYGSRGYGGPCPPAGDEPHHYHVTVYALNVPKLDIPADAPGAMVGYNLNAHKIATAALIGTFGR